MFNTKTYQVLFHVFKRNLSVKWIEPVGYNTSIKVYNSFTKNKVDLITRYEKSLSWYSCGPTVYDSAHLGHACCYMRNDLIRRILENFFDINVAYVVGVTDIDDKIIAKANEIGVNYKEISMKYEKEFFKELSDLDIKAPLKARVTDHIDDIVDFINNIVNSGYGYVVDGTVNFSVDKFPLYGKLVSKQEETECENKESSRDFALWKRAKKGEPFWDSPWGPGRPGWHIECSTIASKILGTSIDIHSGGIDLKFPHHENEEAQCCAHHKTNQWVNYWLHSGHLYLSPEAKMSKSLKNTISIKDFLTEYSANHLRMLCMMVPYRNAIEYTPEVINNAVTLDKKLTNFLSDSSSFIKSNETFVSVDESLILKELDMARKSVLEHLKDDFDTSSALNSIIRLITLTNSQIRNQSPTSQSPSYSIIAVYNFINSFLEKLGFSQNAISQNYNVENVLENVINFRSQVRKTALSINKKDSKEMRDKKKELLTACDSLRDDLFKSGVHLKDHGHNTSWSISLVK